MPYAADFLNDARYDDTPHIVSDIIITCYKLPGNVDVCVNTYIFTTLRGLHSGLTRAICICKVSLLLTLEVEVVGTVRYSADLSHMFKM